MLIDRELISVLGEHTDDKNLCLLNVPRGELAIREAKIVARAREVDTDEWRLCDRGDRLHSWEGVLDARERRAELASMDASWPSTTRVKVGRNERCPCWSGLKCRRGHGRPGYRPAGTWCSYGRVRNPKSLQPPGCHRLCNPTDSGPSQRTPNRTSAHSRAAGPRSSSIGRIEISVGKESVCADSIAWTSRRC